MIRCYAAATITDEPGISERQIIDNEYAPAVTIRADNKNRPANLDFAVIFDSRQDSKNPNVPDLQYPWSSGSGDSSVFRASGTYRNSMKTTQSFAN